MLTFTASNGSTASLQASIVGLMDQTQPVLLSQFGLRAEDIQAYGFLGSDTDPGKHTGGGAILIGSAFTSPSTPPQNCLTAQPYIYSEYNGFPESPLMRQVCQLTFNNSFFVWDDTTENWIAFQGPTPMRPTTAFIGQFYTDTTTQQILVNTNTTSNPNTQRGAH